MSRASIGWERKVDRSSTHFGGGVKADGISRDILAAHGADVARHGLD